MHELIDLQLLLLGDSPPVAELRRRLALVATTDAPVWLHGEVGTGREMIAREIHDRSVRAPRSFMPVNAVSLPGDQLEEYLFAGAEPSVLGAHEGTLFIDGVSELAPGVQAKLLRIIDEQRFRLRGTDHAVDVRVIVADERRTMNVGGRLRRELYYRLRTHELDIPPLRERFRDISVITTRMLERMGARLSPAARAWLEGYPFPGNLRELADALAHGHLVAAGAPIEVVHLPADIRDGEREPERTPSEAVTSEPDEDIFEPLETVTRRFERDYLLRVLRSVNGNRTRAASILGLSRKGLWQKLKAHGVPFEEGRETYDLD